jgi:hypothetical protein
MTTAPERRTNDARDNDATSFLLKLSSELKKLSAGITRISKEKSPKRRSELLTELSSCLRDLGAESAEAQRISEIVRRDASAAFLELDAVIRDLCEKKRWRLDGHWPDYFIDLAVPLHVDEKAQVIEINAKAYSTDELELAIAAALRDALSRAASPAKFMAMVVAAYDKLGSPDRTQVAILDVYKQIVIDVQSQKFWRNAASTAFTPFSVDQFRGQLSRMLEAGISGSADGRELRLVPPLNPKDAVFMYQPAERRFGFVGRIEFVRV